MGFDVKDAVHLEDVQQLDQKVMAIGLSKSLEDAKFYKDTGQLTVRKKGFKMFQYKFYKDQQPLQLSVDEMDQVYDTIMTSTDASHRVIASKVLIKLLIDIYATRDSESISYILSTFFEMLNSNQAEIRVHSFNLLFNLSIHFSMFDDINDPENGEFLRWIHDDLFGKLNEMLLYIFHHDERDDKVWHVAFNCLLHFLTFQGKISQQMLFSVDPRIFPVFLRVLGDQNDMVNRKLVRMIVNMLYSGDSLNMELLTHMGGINFIVGNYMYTRSLEARDNLFRVIFDQVVYNLNETDEKPEQVQIDIIYELLKRFDAPQILSQMFKFPPDKFVEQFVRFMFFEQLKKDESFNEVSNSLNKPLIVRFLYELERVALSYWHLEPEFDDRLKNSITNGEITEADQEILTALLHSDVESDRVNGESWLFAIIRAMYSGLDINGQVVDDILFGLLDVPKASTRRIYLSITEKLVQLHMSRVSVDTDRLALIFNVMNENLMNVLHANDFNESNLLFMVNILFNFLAIRPPVYQGTTNLVDETMDTSFSLFLKGQVYVPLYLLERIDSQLLLHLFLRIAPTFTDIRVTLLILLIEQCRNSEEVLGTIGGIEFFRALLQDKEPRIAFFASSFLMSSVADESIMDQVSAKIKDGNEYLLIQQYVESGGEFE
eukprot:TRINITY_DN440_c0_g1_i1.p1 TRINITY_DN440_c0_g1~~TRINITY_DN440_c0_g1_i1.p1  ORF type:complete len:660 (-),score=260.08 TRINITY_DN440_c0_g1_i1:30-2009(-)